MSPTNPFVSDDYADMPPLVPCDDDEDMSLRLVQVVFPVSDGMGQYHDNIPYHGSPPPQHVISRSITTGTTAAGDIVPSSLQNALTSSQLPPLPPTLLASRIDESRPDDILVLSPHTSDDIDRYFVSLQINSRSQAPPRN